MFSRISLDNVLIDNILQAMVETGERICEVQCNSPTFTVAWHPSKPLLAFACDDKVKNVVVCLFGICLEALVFSSSSFRPSSFPLLLVHFLSFVFFLLFPSPNLTPPTLSYYLYYFFFFSFSYFFWSVFLFFSSFGTSLFSSSHSSPHLTHPTHSSLPPSVASVPFTPSPNHTPEESY